MINQGSGFFLDSDTGYFRNKGVDVMAFDDFYPEGHQSGVSIIMHGNRIATCGDLRFDKLPGQFQPVPKQGERILDEDTNTITVSLEYPDPERVVSANPVHYPDVELSYKVTVKGEGESVIVTVDLDAPVPAAFVGKVCFIMELFPAALFGKPWIMDGKQGIFPVQPNGPVYPLSEDAINYLNEAEPVYRYTSDDIHAVPYAVGRRLTVRPDDPYGRFVIESKDADMNLYDGRMQHNNGWFVVSSEIPAGVTKNALTWVITPNVVDDWLYAPVIQASQVGYHPGQPKVAIIELDNRDTKREKAILLKVTETGLEQVFSADGKDWGRFLRYDYLKFDFTNVKDEGIYKVKYGASESEIFRIAEDVYDRGIWQPVLEYFLPVQMCHMRVKEKYRVWHDLCHMDDAQMAPLNHIHFDGYFHNDTTRTKYNPGDHIPGLNVGGWHDAGDDDLRVESQAGECYILAMAYEAFNVDYDVTTIDQETKTVEIHQPDGKNDILQQIEHGMLSVVDAYRALGRLYRGIIVNNLRQYTHLGDPSAQTDNIPGNADDRWVFTEDNPFRELKTAAQLAAVARVLKGFNDTLSEQSLEAACDLFDITKVDGEHAELAKIHAAVELFLTTGEQKYKDFLLSQTKTITGAMNRVGWFIGRAEKAINDPAFTKAIRDALPALKEYFIEMSAETPYGIPYRPHIWGAGWMIQRQGFEYYYLHQSYPDIFGPEMVFDSLNFVLGCHPGSNNMSFASGIGTKSALIAYGWNRADWSFCPGGVISGTALIRPDFPELLEFPFLWQQTEYVLGGGSSHYMFLVLAAQQILKGE